MGSVLLNRDTHNFLLQGKKLIEKKGKKKNPYFKATNSFVIQKALEKLKKSGWDVGI